MAQPQTHHTVRTLDETKHLIADHGEEEGLLVSLGQTISKLSEAPAMAKRLREMKDRKGWIVIDLKGLEPLAQISGDLFHAARSLSYIIDITKASTSAVDAGNKVEPDPAQRARIFAEKLRLGNKALRVIDGGNKVDPDPSQRDRIVADKLRLGNRSPTYPSKPLRAIIDEGNKVEPDPGQRARFVAEELRMSKRFVPTNRLGIDATRLGTAHSDDFSGSLLSPKRRIEAARLGTSPTGPDDASSKASVSAKRSMGKASISPDEPGNHQDERRGTRTLEFAPAHFPEKLLVEKHVRRARSAERGSSSRRSLSAERHSIDRPKGRFVTPDRARGVHAIGSKLLKAPVLGVSNVGHRIKKLGLDLLRDEEDVAHLRAELIACKKEVVAVWNSKVSLI